MTTIRPITALPGHDGRVWHVSWNPSKPLLASCSSDKTVRIYKYNLDRTFSHLTTLETEHVKSLRHLAWPPSGTTLAVASFDASATFWVLDKDEDGRTDWECEGALDGPTNEWKCISYSSSGTLLAACARSGEIWIWEVLPDCEVDATAVLQEHTQDVKCLAWHPTEEILASGSYDDTIKLFEDDPEDDWYCFATLKGHTSTVWSLAWSPNGQYLASASDDRTIRIWKKVSRSNNWPCVLRLEGHERVIYSISWGPGKGSGHIGWIASAGGDSTIRVWEIAETESGLTSKPLAKADDVHDGHDVNTITWCPREGYQDVFATAGDEGTVRIWQVE